MWNLKKARPDPKREFSALSGPVFRNTWQDFFFRLRVRVRTATGLGQHCGDGTRPTVRRRGTRPKIRAHVLFRLRCTTYVSCSSDVSSLSRVLDIINPTLKVRMYDTQKFYQDSTRWGGALWRRAELCGGATQR